MEGKLRILVIGDIMLDHYTYVTSTRTSEEAPVPVWDEVGDDYRLGGAANVAANLASIGGEEVEVHLAGIAGSYKLMNLIDLAGVKHERVFGHQSMVKRRYVDRLTTKILARVDNFKEFDPEETDFFQMMTEYWAGDTFDAIIFSDYDKGTLTDDVVSMFRTSDSLVVVDSKRADLRIFSGADVLKVNHEEYSAQVSNRLYPNVCAMFKNVVVTRGGDGADLIMCERDRSEGDAAVSHVLTGHRYVNHTEHFPISPTTVVDVTGCGDTHTAAMAFCMLKTKDIRSAVKFANQCAGQVVKQFGTSVARPVV